MFVASHIASGSLVYDALKDEGNPWVKVSLALAGFFIFHWMLDLMPVYHDMDWPWNGFQWGIFWFNMAFVALIWWACKRHKHWWFPPNRVLWGVGAWLIWDIWWLFDAQGGPHRLLSVWHVTPKWPEPHSFIVEGLFILVVILLSLPAIKKWGSLHERHRRLY